VGEITQKSFTASLIPTISKVYDGTTVATLGPTNYIYVGLISGETCTVNQATGVYDSKDVGTNIGVTVTLVSSNFEDYGGSGFDTNNYLLPGTATGAVGEITQKSLTASLVPTISKVYDGTTVATLGPTNYIYDGLISNDEVFESAADTGPLEFIVGSGSVLPGLEQAVLDMTENEQKTVTLPPAETYGPKREELILTVKQEAFSGKITPQPGMDGKQINPLSLQHPAEIAQLVLIQGLAQPDFGGKRQLGLLSRRRHQGLHQHGLLHETAARPHAADGGRRTAQVEIDDLCLQCVQFGNRRGDLLHPADQQLIRQGDFLGGTDQIGGEGRVFHGQPLGGEHLGGQQADGALLQNEPAQGRMGQAGHGRKKKGRGNLQPFELERLHLIHAGCSKIRHTGENRCPVFPQLSEDTGSESRPLAYLRPSPE